MMSYADLANLVTFRPLERPVGSGPTRLLRGTRRA